MKPLCGAISIIRVARALLRLLAQAIPHRRNSIDASFDDRSARGCVFFRATHPGRNDRDDETGITTITRLLPEESSGIIESNSRVQLCIEDIIVRTVPLRKIFRNAQWGSSMFH